MFTSVYQFLRDDTTRVLYILILTFVILACVGGCSIGKLAFQAEDVKVEKPYATPTP